jgi:hypothetical protein
VIDCTSWILYHLPSPSSLFVLCQQISSLFGVFGMVLSRGEEFEGFFVDSEFTVRAWRDGARGFHRSCRMPRYQDLR